MGQCEYVFADDNKHALVSSFVLARHLHILFWTEQQWVNLWNTNTNRGGKSETMVYYKRIFIHKFMRR